MKDMLASTEHKWTILVGGYNPLTHRSHMRFKNIVFKIQPTEALPPQLHPALGIHLLFISLIS